MQSMIVNMQQFGTKFQNDSPLGLAIAEGEVMRPSAKDSVPSSTQGFLFNEDRIPSVLQIPKALSSCQLTLFSGEKFQYVN